MTLRLRLATSPRYSPVPRCSVVERLVERDGPVRECPDRPFLRLPVAVIVRIVRRRDDDAIADAPAGDRLGQRHGVVALLGRGSELDPGAAQGHAVKVHPAAAADDGRARLLVHALDVDQPDECGVFGLDGPLRRPDFEGGPIFLRIGRGQMGLAVESLFRIFLASLDLDEADVEPGVLVGREAQGAGDVDAADWLIRDHVVRDAMAGTDQDAGAGTGHLASLPGSRGRPGAAPSGAADGQRLLVFPGGIGQNRGARRAGQADQGQGSKQNLWVGGTHVCPGSFSIRNAQGGTVSGNAIVPSTRAGWPAPGRKTVRLSIGKTSGSALLPAAPRRLTEPGSGDNDVFWELLNHSVWQGGA